MVSARRRLDRLEASIAPPRDGRPSHRSPEEEAERERRFADLYRELGVFPGPAARDPADRVAAFEPLFEAIEEYRENYRKEQRWNRSC